MVIVTGGHTSHLSSNYNVVAIKVQNRRGHNSKRKSSRFELFPMHSRAATAVGVNCWEDYLSSDASDKSHLPLRLLVAIHRGTSVSVFAALSHLRGLMSAGKLNGRTDTEDVCV